MQRNKTYITFMMMIALSTIISTNQLIAESKQPFWWQKIQDHPYITTAAVTTIAGLGVYGYWQWRTKNSPKKGHQFPKTEKDNHLDSKIICSPFYTSVILGLTPKGVSQHLKKAQQEVQRNDAPQNEQNNIPKVPITQVTGSPNALHISPIPMVQPKNTPIQSADTVNLHSNRDSNQHANSFKQENAQSEIAQSTITSLQSYEKPQIEQQQQEEERIFEAQEKQAKQREKQHILQDNNHNTTSNSGTISEATVVTRQVEQVSHDEPLVDRPIKTVIASEQKQDEQPQEKEERILTTVKEEEQQPEELLKTFLTPQQKEQHSNSQNNTIIVPIKKVRFSDIVNVETIPLMRKKLKKKRPRRVEQHGLS